MEAGKQSKTYVRGSLAICAMLVIVGYIVQRMAGLPDLTTPLVVSTVFSVAVAVVEAWVWKRVAQKPVDDHITFFMAVSGFRFLLALAVLVAYFLIAGRAAMAPFIVVFLTFYLAMLAYHVRFFSPKRHAAATQQ